MMAITTNDNPATAELDKIFDHSQFMQKEIANQHEGNNTEKGNNKNITRYFTASSLEKNGQSNDGERSL